MIGDSMRIAILAPHAGYMVGGLETAAKGLRKHLSEGHECEIFSLAESTWTKRVPGIQASSSSILVRKLRLNYLNHLTPNIYIIKDHAISEISYSYHLLPVLRQFNPDILINFNFSIIALFCKYYSYRFKVPFINVGQAGCVYIEAKSAKTKPDAYVALTPVAKRYIEERVPGVRVVVIPNGVDLNLFSAKGPKLPKDYFLSRSGNPNLQITPPFILSTSRLVKEKRLDLLIKAVSRMEKGTLILVGYGEAKQELLDLANKILKNRALFIDTLSQEDLSGLYRSCDVFSLPSKNEAFGNVLIEAMASGLPVVATEEEGFRWILGDRGGVLVDVTNAQAYAQALQEAYDQDFGDGPLRQAQRFSWQRVGQEYEELIKSLQKGRDR